MSLKFPCGQRVKDKGLFILHSQYHVWWPRDTGHQKPGYWASCPRIFQSEDQGGVSLTFRELSQDILSEFVYCRNHTSYENSKLKLRTCTQSHTKFQLEILTVHVISGIVCFREIILKSSRNDSETIPRALSQCKDCLSQVWGFPC